MIELIIIPILLYLILLLIFVIANQKTNRLKGALSQPNVAIIIPFRNEAKNLMELIHTLEFQSYPKEKLTVYFIDDHSEDDGRTLIPKNQNYRIVESNGLGKKAALETAILLLKEEIVLTTDADSTLQQDWVSTMVSNIVERDLDLLIGGVSINATNWLESIMKIELGNLVASGFAAANMNRAYVANGANLAFKKSLYFKAKSVRKDKHIASGDDVFLLFAAKSLKASIGSINSVASTVLTKMDTKLNTVLHQRVRWIKKAKAYKDQDALLFSTLVFTNNIASILLWFLPIDIELIVIILTSKWFVEYMLYLSLKQNKFNLKEGFYSILLSLGYPFYTFVVALAALVINPTWKGRKI